MLSEILQMERCETLLLAVSLNLSRGLSSNLPQRYISLSLCLCLSVSLSLFCTLALSYLPPQQQQQKTAVNIKSLLKRLYSLSHHPNPYKRLGSALTFKQIYRVFREDPTLVDVFVLEMLHNNIFSLRLAHNDDPSLATAHLGASVIRSLAHVAARHSQILLKPNKARREHKNLEDFVEWLFKVIS